MPGGGNANAMPVIFIRSAEFWYAVSTKVLLNSKPVLAESEPTTTRRLRLHSLVVAGFAGVPVLFVQVFIFLAEYN